MYAYILKSLFIQLMLICISKVDENLINNNN